MIESQMRNGSPIRLLAGLHDFEGRTSQRTVGGHKIRGQTLQQHQRLAVVGEWRWQKGITVFVKSFTLADVRYFEIQEIDKARKWVREA